VSVPRNWIPLTGTHHIHDIFRAYISNGFTKLVRLPQRTLRTTPLNPMLYLVYFPATYKMMVTLKMLPWTPLGSYCHHQILVVSIWIFPLHIYTSKQKIKL